MIDYSVLMKQLEAWVDEYRVLVVNPSAKIRYDVLADRVLWTDEFPHSEVAWDGTEAFIRHVQHVRLEAARAGMTPTDPVWEYFRQVVPSWPGFRADRNGKELLATYERIRSRWIPWDKE